MSRRTARDCAYKLIFEYLFNKEEQQEYNKIEMLEDISITEKDKLYIDEVTQGVAKNYDELMNMIIDNAYNFHIDRIFKPDLAALLLACYEMKFMNDIPLSVSICEIVDLVKCYSTEKSSVFVNGVLSGIYKQLGVKK